MLKFFLSYIPIALAQYTYQGSSPSRGDFFKYGKFNSEGALRIDPSSVPAATNIGDLPNPLGVTTFSQIFPKLLNGITLLAAPIVVAMVLWGAFQIIISAGNPEKLKKGGMTILWAAVGFGLLLLANGVVAIIQSLFR